MWPTPSGAPSTTTPGSCASRRAPTPSRSRRPDEGRPATSVDVQAHVEVARAVRVGGRAEAEALVQALRGRVGLVDVELHPAAGARAGALERRGHERAAEPRAA